MALRDQPYLPLYIQDFMTDEKLIECSAASTGIYIRIMCILHKQEQYGKLLLKQKYKQTSEQILNFASQLATSLPYTSAEIKSGLDELLSEKVLQIEGDFLTQKRMVKDNDISGKRAKAGSEGGKKTVKKFAKAKTKAKHETEYVDEIEYKNEIKPETKKAVEILYPFDSENFMQKWLLWKQYKKEQFNFAYKQIGEQAALKDLASISGGIESTAIYFIENAIAKNWKGIYKPSEQKQNNNERIYTAEDFKD